MQRRAIQLVRRCTLRTCRAAVRPVVSLRCLSSSISSSTPFTSCGPPPASLLPLLSGYGACCTFPVHWGDMDRFGHVNNVAFVKYAESGRVAALLDMAALRLEGVEEATLRSALSSFMSGRGLGVILKSVQVSYKRPLQYPDLVTVGSALTQLQADRFSLSHVILSSSQRAVVAECEGTLVCFDYRAGNKAALPPLVHTAIAQWGEAYAGRTHEQSDSGTHDQHAAS